MNNTSNSPHRVIIVGGGAAGLELATSLGRKSARANLEVTLVDASPTHIWKPLLHEVAAGTLDSTEEIQYLAHARWRHFQFRLGSMNGLDRERREVHVAATLNSEGRELIPARVFSYDTLVLAVGSVSNTFNIPGVREYSRFLDSAEQAYLFQKQLVEAFMSLHNRTDTQAGCLNIAIIGAGATGVELAAELHNVTRQFAIYGVDRGVNGDSVKITVIDGADRLLPALPERLAFATRNQLMDLGVDLVLGSPVTEVMENLVELKNGIRVEADIIVWAAGIKVSDWVADLDGLETNGINQLVVEQNLQTTRDGNIFAMGDCAACPWPGHTGSVPPRAQAAHQQASLLSRSIVNRIHGRPVSDYRYKDYGSLVSLGKYSTVGNLMGNLMGSVSVGGFIARMVYLSLYKMHLLSVNGYFRTTMLTLSNLFRRSAHYRIKLH